MTEELRIKIATLFIDPPLTCISFLILCDLDEAPFRICAHGYIFHVKMPIKGKKIYKRKLLSVSVCSNGEIIFTPTLNALNKAA